MYTTHRAKARRAAASGGFTLIEVLAATFVTTVGLLAAFYLVGLGASVNTDAKITAQAYQAAQQEVEVIRNMPFNADGAFGGLISLTRPASTSTTPEYRFLKPDGTDDASRPGDAGYPGLVPALANLPNGRGGVIITAGDAGRICRNVTVVVRWTDRGGLERNVCIGTIIANGGIDPR
ncbi:MAG TPA: hypothetical protein VGM37_08315 [Armatimonadota bacterium]|jgi:type II secretory pathway pseudopilin PulG